MKRLLLFTAAIAFLTASNNLTFGLTKKARAKIDSQTIEAIGVDYQSNASALKAQISGFIVLFNNYKNDKSVKKDVTNINKAGTTSNTYLDYIIKNKKITGLTLSQDSKRKNAEKALDKAGPSLQSLMNNSEIRTNIGAKVIVVSQNLLDSLSKFVPDTNAADTNARKIAEHFQSFKNKWSLMLSQVLTQGGVSVDSANQTVAPGSTAPTPPTTNANVINPRRNR